MQPNVIVIVMAHQSVNSLRGIGSNLRPSLPRNGAQFALMKKFIHVRGKEKGISLDAFRRRHTVCPPVAIPSLGREDKLCLQTLTLLRYYKWDMSRVHVFIDPQARREDGSMEYDLYWRYMKENSFGEVNLHPGGHGLCNQYNRIFEFFAAESQLVVMSDTVPEIVMRRKRSWDMEQLPQKDLQPLVSLAFALCRRMNLRTWSLGACKSAKNMQPGIISRKCGLLDGNFFGVDMTQTPRIQLDHSGYTTDVEFSVKAWAADGGMIRFSGISAAHEYRASGGHSRSTTDAQAARAKDTDASLKRLAKEYPRLLRFVEDKSCSHRGMKCKFRPIGPKPWRLFGTYSMRGRPTSAKKRPLSVAERVKKHRELHG